MIRPILFNTEMVQAILAGRKTQTRRIIKRQPAFANSELGTPLKRNDGTYTFRVAPYKHVYEGNYKPPCVPGDILWVRETWRPAKGTMHTYIHGEITESEDWHDGYEYRAGGYSFPDGFKESSDDYHLSEIRSGGSWHPSIHMPKEAARIFLRVKDVRVERLQDITVLDAISEGCSGTICDHTDATPTYGCIDCYNTGWLEAPDEEFAQLWDTITKPADRDQYGWNANPWVWVIEFERCGKPEGWC